METYITDTLQLILQVHDANDECWTYGCAVHQPSSHERRHLPLHWSNERMMFVRISEDGSWLTDPDEMAWRERHPDHPYRGRWDLGSFSWPPRKE